ncbi:MAG TPA: RluA family pseudouridine synthase [Spongiibacteraceae bacterium]|nr:RluA family pseudouridine synthase [Spongiibacteraceae bacterium]
MKQEFHFTIESDGLRLVDALTAHSRLPKQRIKDALNKGAVWLRVRGREQRLRRATKVLQRGTQVSLYYDTEVLQREAPTPDLIADEKAFSIWYKPAGMLAQGTHFGDHCALLRWGEKAFTPPRDCFLVHRLDREAEGLMLIAHTAAAAAAFSKLWQQNAVRKQYRVVVEGLIDAVGSSRRIETTLDEKFSATEFSVAALDLELNRSTLIVNLITGRKHQIRRHFAGIGFPVVGDYRYGKGSGEPLALRAVNLEFRCPLTRSEKRYTCD